MKQDNIKSKPREVSIAVKLLYSALILGAINLIFTIVFYPLQAEGLPEIYLRAATGIAIVISILASALFVFFIYKIGKRKDWARIVLLVVLLIAIPTSIVNLVRVFTEGFIPGLFEFFELISRYNYW